MTSVASMDEASQAKIIDVIHAELKEKTVVAIAHRLCMCSLLLTGRVRYADRVTLVKQPSSILIS